jgi:hypothetical protein
MSKVEKITLILLRYEKKQAGADRAPEASFFELLEFYTPKSTTRRLLTHKSCKPSNLKI